MSNRECNEWRRKYDSVLRSKRWKQLKWRLLGERKGCEMCGAVMNLELHHKTYERLGCERDSDVQVVCVSCHPSADKERAAERKAYATEKLYDAQLSGFASAKYGDDAQYIDREQVADEFAAWLEWKEYNA